MNALTIITPTALDSLAVVRAAGRRLYEAQRHEAAVVARGSVAYQGDDDAKDEWDAAMDLAADATLDAGRRLATILREHDVDGLDVAGRLYIDTGAAHEPIKTVDPMGILDL